MIIYLWWRFFFFFRDPNRDTPKGNNIVSPADGTIVYIRKTKKKSVPISIKNKKNILLKEISKLKDDFFKTDQYIIGIFMHPTSVHVNRSPIEGRIQYIKYFNNNKNLPMTLMWWRTLLKMKPIEKYSDHIFENERNTIHIKGKFPVTVVQIADIYVNKIICYIHKKEKVKKGQKIGMIKMGSQVDLIFPYKKEFKLQIEEGDKVKAGETIIAKY